MSPPANVCNETYMGTLVPETQTNGGALSSPSTPQDPLASGMGNYSNGALKLTVTGAAAPSGRTTREFAIPAGRMAIPRSQAGSPRSPQKPDGYSRCLPVTVACDSAHIAMPSARANLAPTDDLDHLMLSGRLTAAQPQEFGAG